MRSGFVEQDVYVTVKELECECYLWLSHNLPEKSLFSNIHLNANAGVPSSVYDSFLAATWVSPKRLSHSLIKTGDTIGKKKCPFE